MEQYLCNSTEHKFEQKYNQTKDETVNYINEKATEFMKALKSENEFEMNKVVDDKLKIDHVNRLCARI